MYSTVDGARRFAKKLQRYLATNGAATTLSRCQLATARAGGFHSWRELNGAGTLESRQIPPFAEFQARLTGALPETARSLVPAWLQHRHSGELIEWGRPDRAQRTWYTDVLPYALAIIGQHRAQTGLFRRGSGKGLTKRLAILEALTIGGLHPELDPSSLSLSVTVASVQRYPNLDGAELGRLVAAGVLRRVEGKLHLQPADPVDLRHRMARWDNGRAGSMDHRSAHTGVGS